ncbi:MAG: hypothetical protein U0704_09305 [Candidatus Eisenbacteria bacterium]
MAGAAGLSGHGTGRALLRTGALVACAALLAGCARAPKPPAGPEPLRRAYAEGRARRAAALEALRADLVIRVDGRAIGRLPAFGATLALGGPERARLQAHGLLGIAFEAAARGDSLFVLWPAERAAFVLGGTAETLGVARPAGFLARTFAATWDPPEPAWRELRADSTGHVLAWREGADSLELSLDGTARPRAFRLRRGAHAVTVRYDEWERVRGREFPTLWTLREARGLWRARVQVDDLRVAVRAEDEWFEWRIPDGTRVLTWSEARALVRWEESDP